jgi:hypothetical protein
MHTLIRSHDIYHHICIHTHSSNCRRISIFLLCAKIYSRILVPHVSYSDIPTLFISHICAYHMNNASNSYECWYLSRVVWDYSLNRSYMLYAYTLVVVMTHQRLNSGVYYYTRNMQRKPIANKYRKGTMKSTLYSTYTYLMRVSYVRICILHITYEYKLHREWKREWNRLTEILHIFRSAISLSYTIYSANDLKHHSAKYNRTEYLCVLYIRI